MTKFFIPNMLEFMYNCFSSRTKEYLFDRLSREEFKKVSTKSKIKKFAESASLEDKLEILPKLNHGCAIIMWDKDKIKTNKIQDVLVAYVEENEKKLGEVIIRDKIFAQMDYDFIKAIQILSKVSSSSNYRINNKYLEISKQIEQFHSKSLPLKLEGERNYKWLISKIDNAYAIEPALEQYGITLDQFKTLILLHNSPNGVYTSAIKSKVGKPITKLLPVLYKKNMAVTDVKNKDIIHIDIMGIITVEQIVSRL